MEHAATRDPDELALLIVQQYLQEQGFTAALEAVEKQDGRTYLQAKLPNGSMLLEMIYKALEAEASQQDDKRQTTQEAQTEEDALISAASATLPTHKCPVAWLPHRATVTALAIHGSLGLSGAGNGQVRCTNADGSVSWVTQVAANGILALAVVPPPYEGGRTTIVATSMDGGVTLVAADTGSILARCSPHRKYVVAAAVTSSRRVVTGSWDATLCVIQLPSDPEDASASCQLLRQMDVLSTHSFSSGIAALAVLPDGHTAVVALRSGCRLRLYDTNSMQEKVAVNMNDFEWDDHLSFSATSLALSPDGVFLLVSTDGPRIMVLRIRDWSKAKLLYGLHTAAQFHHYAACWLGCGHIAAAAAGGHVFVFRLSDGKVVEKLEAHPGSNVRALVSSAAGDRLLTGSFDKSMCIYLTP